MDACHSAALQLATAGNTVGLLRRLLLLLPSLNADASIVLILMTPMPKSSQPCLAPRHEIRCCRYLGVSSDTAPASS